MRLTFFSLFTLLCYLNYFNHVPTLLISFKKPTFKKLLSQVYFLHSPKILLINQRTQSSYLISAAYDRQLCPKAILSSPSVQVFSPPPFSCVPHAHYLPLKSYNVHSRRIPGVFLLLYHHCLSSDPQHLLP